MSLCIVCSREAPFRCSGCQNAYYCGLVHQKNHWRIHRESCQKRIAPERVQHQAGGIAMSVGLDARVLLRTVPAQTQFDPSRFNEIELGWIRRLGEKSVEAILGVDQAEVKQLGQEIFDHYKAQSKNSEEAKRRAALICDSLNQFSGQQGISGAVETAWDGIGDDQVRWMA